MSSLSWFQFLLLSWGKILSSVFHPFLSCLCFLSQMYGSVSLKVKIYVGMLSKCLKICFTEKLFHKILSWRIFLKIFVTPCFSPPQKIFPTSYNPTVFDTYPTDMVLADEEKTVSDFENFHINQKYLFSEIYKYHNNEL